ncbi:hypothetical protein AV274_1226 [Blastocystis sp. ATCC 50177/Nand II]|uniref:Mitochondrial import inner membrane translocase subunit n=1 Tax=Blastocystis sp. subtype 1 (strain ATCC 50177 / NandII) TaxID=478820 RepID=A0A196SMF0_BLAHN|nr:hypothetical protein AV274_1226 [Blastocystis sp. ATCC 50177/Nand II]
MLEWLFGSSSEQVDPHSEKVEEVMQEVRVVKDFYNRMFDMCTSKCNAASLDEDDQLGRDNCMDRCLVKFDETKKVVERELEKKADSSS